MIDLTLKLGDEVLETFKFDKNQQVISIGRDADNDLTIQDSSISRHHAKIEASDNGYLLSDLQSQNGVFVNKNFIRSHWLNNGDKITIGRHTINYSYTSEKVVDTMDRTMVLDVDSYKKMRADSFLNVALGEEENAVKGELFFMDQSRQNFELSQKAVTIGKNPKSDIVAKGFFVAKTAATINQGVGGHYLNYISGMVKPKVNGKIIKESILLKHSAIIELGKLKMKYIIRK
jgi:pSer/pThr/pTyr-binding forkhead associated (FHA) protein